MSVSEKKRLTYNQTELYRKVCEMHEIITGNGEPQKGMIVRLDRLEQTEKSRRKVFWAAVVSAIASLVGVIINSLRVSSNQ